ncbi:MAG: bifunctional 4-hydroxy-2-oxoglutarate aldolase/2-dehydro-3-deoxy-phosphogluconate aldolase [Bacteroidales bacterium]|nr:bifunctional 4-hydroxy-2-oxoglutarate aldolase/2-dehydro-3-deoxy-phosphogluconate aldolase [Bacteroidales bacterium]
MNLNIFEKMPLLGILRGIDESMIQNITDIAIKSGLQAIEITMNTSNATMLISKMCEYAKGRIAVGAGTVLDLKDMDAALNAGASFIVQPIVNKEVIGFCADNKIPVFPGAMTPTEIFTAWSYGATMVKVFPTSVLGATYIKEVKGPLNQIKLLACGGISKTTIGDFVKNGADAVAFGGSIFNLKQMSQGDYSQIEIELKSLIDAYVLAR